ncbi:DUF6151 family protein [Aminobacter sp. AP02]|uniref:GFA family protein n=1 Tax=Aminobacter sp. AP02 TaxID=2135737 RepID=UPI000D6DAC5A|nr:DUF6151 family protein [Aminobacter sp. AP02]PWK68450.1 hypothetical protein C8K44_110127 [Aminobacter sp. AP02]
MTATSKSIVRCSCGTVELEASGAPITSVVCYCDDCQAGSRQLAALPDAAAVQDADGDSAYVLYRADRIRYTKGSERLQSYKIKEKSATNRLVASCCNAAMAMKFDDSRHWTPIYRKRFEDHAPPLQWRICTKFKAEGVEIPNDVPSSSMYPFGFIFRLVGANIAMLLRR